MTNAAVSPPHPAVPRNGHTGPAELAAAVVAGDRRAIARAISIVEREAPESAALVGALFPRTGRALVVGLTGAPGVGKSMLADRLTAVWRAEGRTVGVLAVDPTSPFSGGAILGDRIRMQGHVEDHGVFVRSMATRGQLGGLARATCDALVVLDAAGCDVVLIETVGVGQAEIEISRTADVSLVVTVPGGGDDVQAIKAGIMEIADVFVVNKADRDGADRVVADIEGMLALREAPPDAPRPEVMRTSAATGQGVDELAAAVGRFVSQRGHGDDRSRSRARARLDAIVAERLADAIAASGGIDALVDAVASRMTDPYAAAEQLVQRVVKHAGQELDKEKHNG